MFSYGLYHSIIRLCIAPVPFSRCPAGRFTFLFSASASPHAHLTPPHSLSGPTDPHTPSPHLHYEGMTRQMANPRTFWCTPAHDQQAALRLSFSAPLPACRLLAPAGCRGHFCALDCSRMGVRSVFRLKTCVCIACVGVSPRLGPISAVAPVGCYSAAGCTLTPNCTPLTLAIYAYSCVLCVCSELTAKKRDGMCNLRSGATLKVSSPKAAKVSSRLRALLQL